VSDESFMEQLPEMPFHIIEKMIFKGMKVKIMFKSGNMLEVTAPNDNQLRNLKWLSLEKLHPDQIIEEE